MKKVRFVLIGVLGVAAAAAAPGAVGAPTGAKVSIVIRTATKTLESKTVSGEAGSVTKGGTPRGKCSGKSAAGALDVATKGHWTGKYYKSFGDVLVTSILGVKPTGSHYWGFYVNGKSSSKGVCEVALHAGERLLFKVL